MSTGARRGCRDGRSYGRGAGFEVCGMPCAAQEVSMRLSEETFALLHAELKAAKEGMVRLTAAR